MNEIWVLTVITSLSEPLTLSADDIDLTVELFHDYEMAKAALQAKRKEIASCENVHIDLRKGTIH